jgi:hypothetical protein
LFRADFPHSAFLYAYVPQLIFILSREGKDFFIAPQTFFEPNFKNLTGSLGGVL